MSDKKEEKARLYRRMKEELHILGCAKQNITDALYKLNIIERQLNELNKGDNNE